jgi:hypothetical protein
MQFRIGHLEDEIMEGGELLRPFGPRQIALKFSHIVGTFDAPLSQKELEFWARQCRRIRTLCRETAGRVHTKPAPPPSSPPLAPPPEAGGFPAKHCREHQMSASLQNNNRKRGSKQAFNGAAPTRARNLVQSSNRDFEQ